MANTRQSPLGKELRKLLRDHPDTSAMELLVPDIVGILRSKRIRRQSFEKVCTEGFWFPKSAILMNAIGAFVPGMIGESDGDADTLCTLVPGSLAPVPWSPRQSSQALFRFLELDGRPFFADSRAVLERALLPLKKMRLSVVLATELEFYLLDANTDRPAPLPTLVPGIGRPQIGPQVYHPDDLLEIGHFLDDLYAYCERQGIPADTATSEFAPGQFEINLLHVDDPVLACDHAVLLKRAVKAAARKHGYVACFMAKPFADDAGSGLHIHLSLVDKNGRNYFSHGRESLASPPFSARLHHAVGGLLKTMPEATALFAPNANSYRRLRPEIFAPVEPNWGANHRSVAIRIPQADQKNLRLEHRVAGADANPYLATAAVAAGVHHGLKHKIDPGRMVNPGEAVELKTRIPNRLEYALDKLQRSKVLREYLGRDFVDLYVHHRRGESQQFNNQVNPLDFDWYLRAV